MAYTKKTWVKGSTPLSAENFNHMEQGIADAHTEITQLNSDLNNRILFLSKVFSWIQAKNAFTGNKECQTEIAKISQMQISDIAILLWLCKLFKV